MHVEEMLDWGFMAKNTFGSQQVSLMKNTLTLLG